MKEMVSEIEIGEYIFKNRINSVKVVSSRKTLTDTATVKVPGAKRMLERALKAGDKVVIKLGYDGDLREEFRGFVSSIAPSTPFTIECMDNMWLLMQEPVKAKSWKSVTLKQVFQYLNLNATIEVPEITLSPFRIEKEVKSKAKVLEALKKEYGLDVYFRGEKLFVGLAYSEEMGSVRYRFSKPSNAKMDKLVFRSMDEVKVQLEAISIGKDNKKTKVTVGDEKGEKHTLHFYNKTEKELRSLATAKLDLFKYDGYKGTFKAKGQPSVVHGMEVNLEDDNYPERAGSYFVDGVTTTSDTGGFNRNVELGKKSA